MQISTDGLRLLRTFEGLRTSVYNDVAGLQTIGFGHRVKSGEAFPSAITPARAEQLLAQDVACAERAVNRLVTVPQQLGRYRAPKKRTPFLACEPVKTQLTSLPSATCRQSQKSL